MKGGDYPTRRAAYVGGDVLSDPNGYVGWLRTWPRMSGGRFSPSVGTPGFLKVARKVPWSGKSPKAWPMRRAKRRMSAETTSPLTAALKWGSSGTKRLGGCHSIGWRAGGVKPGVWAGGDGEAG